MNSISKAVTVVLLANATATFAITQAPPPSSADPSAASSPHQRQATDSAAGESPATNSAEPGAASSPHQREAMGGAAKGEGEAAVQGKESPASFVKKAAQDGMTEVELGKLALTKSSNSQVKQFAQKMVQDHGTANKELAGIAKGKGLDVPAQLDAQHQDMVKTLSSKSGAAFDSAYAEHMAMDHTKAVALFRAEATSNDPELAGFAKKTLPTLQEHKQLADTLQSSTGAATARTP
ncbi:MAG: putative outer membrane protein [Gammaproteobacteria bacterium]|jgi:putative membrane protein|nr:putative outer membrane protein [Gammaproteobacteria bacterium]